MESCLSVRNLVTEYQDVYKVKSETQKLIQTAKYAKIVEIILQILSL